MKNRIGVCVLAFGLFIGVISPVIQVVEASSPPLGNFVCGMRDTLSLGSRGSNVSILQSFLASEGFFDGEITEYFGFKTERALRTFQIQEGVANLGSIRSIFGPLTRARIAQRCGTPVTQCKPINYMAPLCDDGTAPISQQDEHGCVIGYQCPVANYTPPATCKVWNDGCNSCSRSTPDGAAACTMRACFAAGKGYCSVYFGGTTSTKPSIRSFSGPTQLAVNQSGTWSVSASDRSNGALSYSVTWGDEVYYAADTMLSRAASVAFTQQTTFTHSYAQAGTYTVRMVVQNQNGGEAQTSMTVIVSGGNVGCLSGGTMYQEGYKTSSIINSDGTTQTVMDAYYVCRSGHWKIEGSLPVACTMEYAPVCGQPPEPACRHSVPACMIDQGPQTYGNRCSLNAAGATFLYSGECR